MVYKFHSSIFPFGLIVYYFFSLLLSTTFLLDFTSLLCDQIANTVSRHVSLKHWQVQRRTERAGTRSCIYLLCGQKQTIKMWDPPYDIPISDIVPQQKQYCWRTSRNAMIYHLKLFKDMTILYHDFVLFF